MNPLIKNMLIVVFGFSWPVVLAFAGTVTTFQVFIGTATSGILYFVIRALLGYAEVGTISLMPTIIIAICGVMNAVGIEKYVPLLATPKYAGGALALTNMMSVLSWADDSPLRKRSGLLIVVLTLIAMGSVAGTLGNEKCVTFAYWANAVLAMIFIVAIAGDGPKEWKKLNS